MIKIVLRGPGPVVFEKGSVLRPERSSEDYPEGSMKVICGGQMTAHFSLNDIIEIGEEDE